MRLAGLRLSGPAALAVVGLVAVGVSSGCSVKRIAINSIANTLAESGDTFASDEDPELVRDAVPFSLKLMESVLAETPKHRGLLLAACSGFTQYAYAFVQADAEEAALTSFEQSEALDVRARRLYLRAKGYCVRNLEVAYPGIAARLAADPTGAVRELKREDVAAVYWTGASWGSAISLGLDRPELIAELPVVRALLGRALTLDEAWSDGAIHDVFITLDGLPEAMGGSKARARDHFRRSVELSKGLSAGPYVALATGVVVAEQNLGEFQSLLKQALAIDPDKAPGIRLANLIAQKRARFLLEHADLYILSE